MNPFVLGVDLDGVCGDFTEAFKHVVADELGVPVESLPTNRSWGFDAVSYTHLTLPTSDLV